jgi:hypothetical protein
MCFLILFSSRWIDQGLEKVDQQTILDDFNKHSPAITQPSTAPPVAPQPPPLLLQLPILQLDL